MKTNLRKEETMANKLITRDQLVKESIELCNKAAIEEGIKPEDFWKALAEELDKVVWWPG